MSRATRLGPAVRPVGYHARLGPQARNDTYALISVRAGDLIVAWRRRQIARTTRPMGDWITREFACRGLVPPHSTPAALARALERERGISITFVPHVSAEPGVSG